MTAAERRHAEYTALLARAQDAGCEAAKEVPDTGPCGWAWVHVSDGNSSFGRWLLANGHRRGIVLGNYRGVRVDAQYLGQSVFGSRRYAEAVAEVFKAAGIECRVEELWD